MSTEEFVLWLEEHVEERFQAARMTKERWPDDEGAFDEAYAGYLAASSILGRARKMLDG
jgi:hypothetical protein